MSRCSRNDYFLMGLSQPQQTLRCISYLQHKTNDWVRSKINFIVGPHEPLLATVKSMSHATTASPKPSFRAPWKAGDTVVGRGNVRWTTSKIGHPCSCQICSQGPPAEKTGRGSMLNRPSCLPSPPPHPPSPSDDPIGQGSELH